MVLYYLDQLLCTVPNFMYCIFCITCCIVGLFIPDPPKVVSDVLYCDVRNAVASEANRCFSVLF